MKNIWVPFVIIAMSWCFSSQLQAAAGDLDPLFGTGGSVTTDIDATSDTGFNVVLQPDGKIIVAGNALNTITPQINIALVRYNPNGSLDPTFGTGGKVITPLASFVTGMVLQTDNKIVVSAGGLIVRFNPNGTLDPTFGSGGSILAFTRSIAIQSDGKIVAVGANEGDFGVTRFNPNGSLDPTFGSGGQVITNLGGNEITRDVAIQPDSKIVVTGDTNGLPAVVRYNPNGSLDPTFGSGGIVNTNLIGRFLAAITIDPDNKILLGGRFQNNGIVVGGDSDFVMVRFNPNGTPDPTFGSGGEVIHDIGDREELTDFAIQPNGKIVAVGSIEAPTPDFVIARYNTNGSPDPSFGSGGSVITDFAGENDTALAVAIQPDGFIVAAGTSSIADDDFVVARYEGDLIVQSCNRFTDVFEDGILDPDWTYVKLTWTEVGGNLVGTPIRGKAEAIASPAFAGCTTAPCTVQTILQTAGGFSNKIFFFGWFQNKQNTLEVLMKEENDKWVLRQRAGGAVVAKTKVSRTILPNVPYDVKVNFDGTTFTLSIDNISLVTLNAGAAPSGTVGYRVKNTTGRFSSVCVN